MKSIITEIKLITTSQTLDIRHKVMWPNKPIEYVKLPNDENGRHFGLLVNGKITSIISLFVENNEMQFRKFATLKEYQEQGFGTILLKNIIDLSKKEGIKRLWCNARAEKSEFYKRFNFKPTKVKFIKDGIEYVIMEKKH